MKHLQDKRIQLLLIEDDDGDAVLFAQTLSACAGMYQLQVRQTLTEATDWLQEHTCDLILLDLSLPDSFGLEGIEKIHALRADVPIVMLTGLDDDETALDALDHGAQDYLVKGAVTPRELERTVRHAIQRQQIQNENRRLVDELQHAATSDALTGVLNRHAMTREFERQWSGSRSTDTCLSCVILDVDHFKRINDEFGHLAGDEVLQAVAQLISGGTRPTDCIARYGGEEFCVILVGANEESAVRWAERARKQLADTEFILGDRVISVTASFGAAERSESMTCVEDLIDAADKALIVAKKSGRNTVVAAGDSASSAKFSPHGAVAAKPRVPLLHT